MIKKEISIVILAAGKGSRMKSNIPKVFHMLDGKTILEHVIQTAKSVNPKKIILVCNNKIASIASKFYNISNLFYVIQDEPIGTGHAILLASREFSENETILVLYGDVPLISKKSIEKLQKLHEKSDLTLLTAKKIKYLNGYGRIIRKNKKIIKIVEEKDAQDRQKKIKEIYSGIFISSSKNIIKWLKKIDNQNKQNEFYATDIVKFAYIDKALINNIEPLKKYEIFGINNKLQLSILEKIIQKEKIHNLMISGVTLKNPSHFTLRGKLIHGINVTIDIGVILENHVTLGDNVDIGPGCIIKNSIIKSNTKIHAYTIIEDTIIDKNCVIGPFAHLRKNILLGKNVQIGNFVEIKDSIVKKESKIKHLSYISDSEIGKKVNIGAGSITCNYDGLNKFKTIIGNNVSIGSDTQLIAPINIANNTTIAAGTTLMKNVDTPCLVYNMKIQKHKKEWTRPNKNCQK